MAEVQPPRDNRASLEGGRVCDKHTGEPCEAYLSWSGVYICPICTPLGRNPEHTRQIVLRANRQMNGPYWIERGPVT
ncbi:hypothetical protein ACFWY6_18960 [Streptomyces sp. NPDC059037]|uniref:hypothetical protein n=1 Tax=Streptomyces sp. NPDC059037 TaxID=3346710 RepID=UPI0036960E11